MEGGVEARVLDIPVPPPSHGGVFDVLAARREKGKRRKATRKAAERLEAAIKAHQGSHSKRTCAFSTRIGER
jgi:hypothetical protein